MAFSCRGHTLMVMKQESNEPSEEFLQEWQMKLIPLTSKYRIEVHIYTNEWLALHSEMNPGSSSPKCILGLATKLLVMVTAHVKDLTGWFPGMLVCPSPSQPFVTYLPCWKCHCE